MPIPFIPPLRSTTKSAPLPVVMSGVRAGERVLQIGIDDAAVAGAIAARPGINGRSAFMAADDRGAARARKIAEDAMTLADVAIASAAPVPFADAAFDLIVLHARTGTFGALDDDRLLALVRDAHRTLRPGGRIVVLAPGTPVGLKAILRSSAPPARIDAEAALQRAGYRPVRVLADREGYLFTEGLKPKA
jgi:SAM-dependent methyltransferase